ncbi:unnamed protein product [Triticum turgidum subsp. durum]|uniref:Legume lectin domain-containing protein n=1 Tax=Triticum turgidum subsp. durum TaxID=4567 RepID=A0A9R1P4B7_TRITD|nr:unnamed protein product [Triticum turgidum subsp. durum]
MKITNTDSMSSLFCIACAAVAVILGTTCSCLQFTYPSFNTGNRDDFSFSPGSAISNNSLQITPSNGNMSHKSGRVVYAKETLKLWNAKRTALTSFRTEFVLNIIPQGGGLNGSGTGEGMAFFLTNNPSLPSDSSGQWLGLTNNKTDGAPANRIVAVEFDTRRSFEAEMDGNHVGLDLNSVRSVGQSPLSNLSLDLSSGSDLKVTLAYDGAALSTDVLQMGRIFSNDLYIDLSRYLLDNISVGFAASTGEFAELNQVKSWNFTTYDNATAGDDGGM